MGHGLQVFPVRQAWPQATQVHPVLSGLLLQCRLPAEKLEKHKPVCRAAVVALARRATRERLARAVREKGKDEVEHSADDDVCVICQDTTVDTVEVSVWEVHTR